MKNQVDVNSEIKQIKEMKKDKDYTQAHMQAVKWLLNDLKPYLFSDQGGSNCPQFRKLYGLKKMILRGDKLGIKGLCSVMDFLGYEINFKKK